jgi:hypothetical protein
MFWHGTRVLALFQSHLVAATGTLTLLFLMWQAVWAISTPAFRSPDEPQHVNSILRVAAGKGWPDPGEAYLSASVLEVGHESGMISPDSIGFDVTDRTQLFEHYSSETVPLFNSMAVTPHSERSSLTYTGYLTSQVDQMTQHPPVFYYIEAFIFRLFGAESWPWDRQILLMRLVSAVMTVPLIPSVVFTARKMGTSERGALAAGIMAFGVPQLAFITGSVTNDSLTIGLGSIVLAVCGSHGTKAKVMATRHAGGARVRRGTLDEGNCDCPRPYRHPRLSGQLSDWNDLAPIWSCHFRRPYRNPRGRSVVDQKHRALWCNTTIRIPRCG